MPAVLNEKEWKCSHVQAGQLPATATATYALDPDGPVKRELEPLRVRLCPFCAGRLYAVLHRVEQEGVL